MDGINVSICCESLLDGPLEVGSGDLKTIAGSGRTETILKGQRSVVNVEIVGLFRRSSDNGIIFSDNGSDGEIRVVAVTLDPPEN